MAPKTKQEKSIIVRLLVLGVSIYMIITLISLFGQLTEKREKLIEKQKTLANSQLELDDLKKLLNEGTKDQIIEKAARDRLGYVFSEEEVFLDISGSWYIKAIFRRIFQIYAA